MMRLDHNRAVSQVAQKIGKPVSAVRNMTVWGNHSATQYPDLFRAEAGGQKVWPMINDQTWLENTFIPTVQKRGAAIIEARGLSSAASAANAAVDHIRDWVSGTHDGDWVSMGVPSDGSYGIPEGVIYGYPVTCKGGTVPDRQGHRHQRVLARPDERHAEGAARGKGRSPEPPGMSAGKRFREALAQEKPLQIIGTINANHALMAQRVGFRSIYLSGGGVAAGSLGMPDLGISGLEDVLIDIRRITDVCDLPLLVDVDTGFGASAFNVARTTRSLIKAGAAAMHIEDQVGAKRCGHRPGKELVSADEMADRIKSAVDARTDPGFVVMARTDALANEGLEKSIQRSIKYVEAGADMIFPEAIPSIDMYRKFADAVKVPVLANITEFGKSPLFTVEELRSANVAIVLYPLSAFRAMNKAAMKTYQEVRAKGTQKGVIGDMQTREELYEVINYHSYEKKLDELFTRGRS